MGFRRTKCRQGEISTKSKNKDMVYELNDADLAHNAIVTRINLKNVFHIGLFLNLPIKFEQFLQNDAYFT